MSDKATLRRLLREISGARRTEEIIIAEESIINLFDSVREELAVENDRLTASLAVMTRELEHLQGVLEYNESKCSELQSRAEKAEADLAAINDVLHEIGKMRTRAAHDGKENG